MSGDHRPTPHNPEVEHGQTMAWYSSIASQPSTASVLDMERTLKAPGALCTPEPPYSPNQHHGPGVSGLPPRHNTLHAHSEGVQQRGQSFYLPSQQIFPEHLREPSRAEQSDKPRHPFHVQNEDWQAKVHLPLSSSQPQPASQNLAYMQCTTQLPQRLQYQENLQEAPIARNISLYIQQPALPTLSQDVAPVIQMGIQSQHSQDDYWRMQATSQPDLSLRPQVTDPTGPIATISTESSSSHYQSYASQVGTAFADKSPHFQCGSTAHHSPPLLTSPSASSQGSIRVKAAGQGVYQSHADHTRSTIPQGTNGFRPLPPSLVATVPFPYEGVASAIHTVPAEGQATFGNFPLEVQESNGQVATKREEQVQQGTQFTERRSSSKGHRLSPIARTMSHSKHFASQARCRKSPPSSQHAFSRFASGAPVASSQVSLAPAASAAVQGIAKRCAQAAKASRAPRGTGSTSGASRSSVSSVSSSGPSSTLQHTASSVARLNGTASVSATSSSSVATSVRSTITSSQYTRGHGAQQPAQSFSTSTLQHVDTRPFDENIQHKHGSEGMRPPPVPPSAEHFVQPSGARGGHPSADPLLQYQATSLPTMGEWTPPGINGFPLKTQGVWLADPDKCEPASVHQEVPHESVYTPNCSLQPTWGQQPPTASQFGHPTTSQIHMPGQAGQYLSEVPLQSQTTRPHHHAPPHSGPSQQHSTLRYGVVQPQPEALHTHTQVQVQWGPWSNG